MDWGGGVVVSMGKAIALRVWLLHGGIGFLQSLLAHAEISSEDISESCYSVHQLHPNHNIVLKAWVQHNS